MDKPQKVKRSESRQYAYVEDYYYQYPQPKKEEDEQNKRGMVEIDLNNGKAIEIT